MKKNKFDRKLTLNKKTIVSLTAEKMSKVKGGLVGAETGCMDGAGSGGRCGIVADVDPA